MKNREVFICFPSALLYYISSTYKGSEVKTDDESDFSARSNWYSENTCAKIDR